MDFTDCKIFILQGPQPVSGVLLEFRYGF